jgi:peroxiredoxin
MVDRDGVVAAVHAGPVAVADLERMYAALEKGQPVATPAPTPVPSNAPPPSQAAGEGESIMGLAIGDPAPHWSGSLLRGGIVDSSALLGKPTVIWFDLGGCLSCPTTPLEEFEAAYRRAGTRANFVIVAGGEPTPGWTAERFDRLGITVPLVFDWDQAITRAFQVNVMPTIVLDASGRLVSVTPGTLSADEIGLQLEAAEAAGR